MPDVSIIIVTYNSENYIVSCIQSVLEQKSKISYEVIVVDNASTDKTLELISDIPNVQVIMNVENLGYSRANNTGIRQAKGEYLLLLNPDIMLSHQVLDDLIDSLKQDPHRGIVAPQLKYPNGLIQESARRLPNLLVQTIARAPIINKLFQTKLEKYVMAEWDHQSSRNVDWVIGACMLARRDTILQVGLFDEDYFLYCEDVDLCYRLSKKGYKIYYNASISMTHDYQKSSRRKLNKLTIVHLVSICKFYIKHPELLFK